MDDTAGARTQITHRRVLNVAVPVVVSNATIPLLGLVDTGVVGQLGLAAPIGAVGIGAVILTAIYWIFGFLRMGTSGLAAQALGAGDRAEVAALLTRGLMIGAIAGLAVIAFQVPLFQGAFVLSPASAEVEGLARGYMQVRVWGAPAVIGMFAITGWLIAQERTRAVLAIQLMMNGANIGLDLWFVLGLEWGVVGIAWATLIAEWSGLALGLWLCRAAFRVPDWRDWPRVFDAVRLKRMAVVNSDILMRALMIEGIFVSFLFWGADFGDATLAANQVLLQLIHLTSHTMDGFAVAAETLVGQATGARQRARLRRAAILSSGWALTICAGLSVVFLLFGSDLVALMAKSTDVQAAAALYLPFVVAVPVCACAAFMLDGIFIGATRTRDMRNMMAVSLAIYLVVALVLMPLWGNSGLWVALLVSFVARGATLAYRYPALERSAQG
ncbi:MATE family efflux transporter [Roseovarius aestuarii]|nr:MATE family efflux transporter [Roseovarius aestuarii]